MGEACRRVGARSPPLAIQLYDQGDGEGGGRRPRRPLGDGPRRRP